MSIDVEGEIAIGPLVYRQRPIILASLSFCKPLSKLFWLYVLFPLHYLYYLLLILQLLLNSLVLFNFSLFLVVVDFQLQSILKLLFGYLFFLQVLILKLTLSYLKSMFLFVGPLVAIWLKFYWSYTFTNVLISVLFSRLCSLF